MYAQKIKLCFLIIVFLSLFPLYLYPQFPEIKFEHLSTGEGLSQGSVTCILQDREGFLWFGTEGGLNKYDGYTFTIYKHHPSDSKSLSHNWILSICEGDSFTIWIGTLGGGLNKFDKKTEKFFHYKSEPENPHSLVHNNISVLLKDSQNILWVGTGRAGLHEFDNKTNQFIIHKLPLSETDIANPVGIRSIIEDHNGTLWIGTINAGLFKFDKKLNQFTQYKYETNNPNSLSFNTVNSIYEDKSADLWIGTGFWPLGKGGGLNRLDRETGRFTHFTHNPHDPTSIGADIIHSIFEDSKGNLWVGTYGGGLNRFDRNTDSFIRYQHNSNSSHSLSSNLLMSIFEDISGIIWIGTADEGITKFSPQRAKFTHYTYDPNDSNSLSSKRIWSLLEDHFGILWVGTQNGLNRIDRQTGSVEHYFHKQADPYSLSHNVLGPIFEDRFSVLWIGTDGGLDKFDRNTEKFTHYRHDPDNPYSLSDNGIFTIYEDRQGILWIGTRWGGLNKFDRETERFTHYKHDLNNPNSLSQNAIMKIVEDDSGFFWIATFNGGLNKFNRKSGTFRHFKNDPHDPNSLSHNTVESIHRDASEILWLATWGGLNKFDPRTKEFFRYTTKDGLPDNIVYGILEDNRGNLWLSTGNGLSKFNPRMESFRNYDVSDGLQGNEFSEFAYYKTRRGELLFGGANGFNIFHPDSLQDNSYPPPVVLTDFKIFNEPAQLDQSISTIKEVRLSYKQNFFSFEFAALDYTHPPKNQYVYMLKGIDEDWIYSGNRRFANYTDVKPGEYVFWVRGSNNDGVWNEEGISLSIIITPPFWQTGWFRLLMIIAVAGLIYGLHRYRVSRLLEIERMRTRIASDLHDDIGSTLTRISIYSEIIQKSKSVTKITAAAGEIGAMSREIVATLSDIVWSIDARYDTLGNLLDRMRDFAARLFSSQQIQLDFKTTNLDIAKKIPANVRQNVYLIFKEALNNISKHARATHVGIYLKDIEGAFTMTIQDNGIGFDEKKIQKGNGLKNMKLRAERIDGKLSVNTDKGVLIILTIRRI